MVGENDRHGVREYVDSSLSIIILQHETAGNVESYSTTAHVNSCNCYSWLALRRRCWLVRALLIDVETTGRHRRCTSAEGHSGLSGLTSSGATYPHLKHGLTGCKVDLTS